MSLPRGSLVLVDLKPSLGRYGQVSEAELAAIDAGLRLYLGLEPDPG